LRSHHRQLIERFEAAGLSDDEWRAFEPIFRGEPDSLVDDRLAAAI
jgi:hypothetical protein